MTEPRITDERLAALVKFLTYPAENRVRELEAQVAALHRLVTVVLTAEPHRKVMDMPGGARSTQRLLADTAAAAAQYEARIKEQEREFRRVLNGVDDLDGALATAEDSPWGSDPGFMAVTKKLARTFSEVAAAAIRAGEHADG